jgi:hypothetical protein
MISRDNQAIDYELTYSGLQGTVQQAHIHVAQLSVNGSIVTGIITAANVIAASNASQQIAAGELAEVIAAIRAGVAYANVHTTPLSPRGEVRG